MAELVGVSCSFRIDFLCSPLVVVSLLLTDHITANEAEGKSVVGGLKRMDDEFFSQMYFTFVWDQSKVLEGP